MTWKQVHSRFDLACGLVLWYTVYGLLVEKSTPYLPGTMTGNFYANDFSEASIIFFQGRFELRPTSRNAKLGYSYGSSLEIRLFSEMAA